MGRLVLAGGGHAHLTAIRAIPALTARGHEVVVVGPSERHYYSGMGPGMLGGRYGPDEIRFEAAQAVRSRGGRFVLDAVTRVDAGRKALRLASGAELSYDVCSFNVGSRVQPPHAQGDGVVLPVKPIENLVAARNRIRQLCRGGGRVVVLGGGPGALEVAGNAWRAGQEFGGRLEVTMLAGRGLLRGRPAQVARLARRSLAARSIGVLEGGYVRAVEDDAALLEDGRRIPGDLFLAATGIRPPSLFAESGLPTGPDGGLAVNEFLQCPAAPELFGGGDCIHYAPQPLAKVGVYAVRQNPVLAGNLLAALEGRSLAPFRPGGGYLLIYDLGDGGAIFHKGPLVFAGRAAMGLKEWIDRRFMRRFAG